MILTLAHKGIAQVEFKDRYVTITPEDDRNPTVAIPTDDSCTVVVWQHWNSNNSSWDIMAQKVENKYGLARWYNNPDMDGIVICSAENNQTNPRAAYDGNNGIIVVWEDYRDDGLNQTSRIFAQRILNHERMIDPSWPTDGIAVAPSGEGHQERPRIVGTTGGAFISWMDWRFSTDPNNPNCDIFLQRLLSDGSLPSGWDSYGTDVFYNSHQQINQEMALDYILHDAGSGSREYGIVLAFQDASLLSKSTGNNIYRVRVSSYGPDGSFLYSNTVSKESEEQLHPWIVVPKDTWYHTNSDPIVCWEDWRNQSPIPPYNYQPDIYAQRLDGDQGGVRMWQTNGVPVCDASNTAQVRPIMVVNEQNPSSWAGYACIAWEGDFIGAAMVDLSNGSVISPNGTAGEYVGGNGSGTGYDQIAMDHFSNEPGIDTVYIAWRHHIATPHPNIWYQAIRLSPFGSPVWNVLKANGGMPVTEAKNIQSRPQVSGRIIVFEDERRDGAAGCTTDANIFCQKPGECVGPKEMAWRDVFAVWYPDNDADDKKVVTDTEGNIYLTWGQVREGTHSVFVQKFDVDGVPLWKNNGVKISPDGVEAYNPDIVPDGSGGAVMVWRQWNNTRDKYDIYFAQLDPCTGEIALDPATQGLQTGRFYDLSFYQDDDYDPRIINSVNPQNGFPEYQIAYLRDQGNGIETRHHGSLPIPVPVGDFPYAEVVFDRNSGNPRSTHYQLGLVSDGGSGSWIVTFMPPGTVGNPGNMNVTHVKWTGAWNYHDYSMTPVWYPPSDGYDLCVDNTISTPRDLLVVSSFAPVSNSPMKLTLTRYSANSATLSPILLTIPSGLNDIDSYPAIVSDNTVDPTSGLGGCLFVWTRSIPTSPQYFDRRTVTLRCTYPLINNSVTPRLIGTGVTNDPLDLHPTIISGSPTYPDIAYVNRQSQDHGPSAIVAWTGPHEDECGYMSRKILSQYVLYGIPEIKTVWPVPRYVSPGPEDFEQTIPMLASLHDHTISAFWYDWRTPNVSIAFTRLYDDGSDIGWRKQQGHSETTTPPEIPIEPVLHQNYPNPVSLSDRTSATIPVFLPEDGYVILRIYNLYGQLVQTLQDGQLSAGAHSFRFSPASGVVPSGTYFYSMTTKSNTQTRTMHIVR